jgi:Vacuolar protein sorting protein 36 Vps36
MRQYCLYKTVLAYMKGTEVARSMGYLLILPHRKNKISEYQNGHAYLTSHRACYVDNEKPRSCAVAVDLKDVDHTDFYVRCYYSHHPQPTWRF